ncbi:MAG: hypothetical protein KGL39_34835 [Patescibacteria group bacterium]|nr:hypothetical protein [Patescibacteria group bacterium]
MGMTSSRYQVPVVDLTTHIVEDRRAVVSPWGRGNSKIGPGVYTYSKRPAVTCPGASEECLAICYAIRAEQKNEWVAKLWASNTERGDTLPEMPPDAKLVRFHISGDFDTVRYIQNWNSLVDSYRDVTFWGYTRSWRCPDLLPALNVLHGADNVFLWASMDQTVEEMPPYFWRRAWIEGDARLTRDGRHYRTLDNRRAILCPEATGRLPNCETCRFCFLPHDYDLVFPRH